MIMEPSAVCKPGAQEIWWSKPGSLRTRDRHLPPHTNTGICFLSSRIQIADEGLSPTAAGAPDRPVGALWVSTLQPSGPA